MTKRTMDVMTMRENLKDLRIETGRTILSDGTMIPKFRRRPK